jgi:hypothetical protein
MQVALPLIGALVAGGTAMLVSANLPVAIGVGIGTGIGVWLAQRKQAPPA